MPVKYLPTMRSLAKRTRRKPKWKRTGLGDKGILTAKVGLGVAGGAGAGALVAPKGKRKKAAGYGAVAGAGAGAIGGALVGGYYRAKNKKRKRK